MDLFKCSTLYMLINVINIKVNMYADQKADLLIGDATDFKDIPDKVRALGIFENVYTIEEYNKNKEFRRLDAREQVRVSQEPESFLSLPAFPDAYERLFVGVEDEFHKLLYYALVRRGMCPKVSIYDEGVTAYVLDVQKRTVTDDIDHVFYGTSNFFDNVERILLYQPELFKAPCYHFRLESIPTLSVEDRRTSTALNAVFASEPLPQEKYIFFEEAFYHDRILCNDMQLFEEFAKRVGRENIIVKIHPRSIVDRFTHRGYKVMQSRGFPFEMSLLNYDISNYVFVTITSTATLTPNLIFGKDATVIYLKNLFDGKTLLLTRQDSKAFFEALFAFINRERKNLFSPASFEALDVTLDYLDRRQTGHA